MAFTIGLDYGTNSVRCLIVDISNGNELGSSVYEYETGEAGIVLDPGDHNLARQNPADYIKGIEVTIAGALKEAAKTQGFDPKEIIGIGIDTTGSTPMPVDKNGTPLSFDPRFADNPNAMAWLWKDHTAYAEAAEITELAKKKHPEYLTKCGGTYSSEWFFSKILHCLRTDEAVFDAAYTWYEYCDWLPALLTGNTSPDKIKMSRCAAGHKAMFNNEWGGLPAKDFLAELDPKLGELRDRLYEQSYSVDTAAGTLTNEWARKLGIPAGIPVAVGAFDAHLGAVGSGVGPGKMVQVIGTSSCDLLVWDSSTPLEDIPGVCGVVDGSVLPGYFGIEAGQSAVGDIFNWFVSYIQPGGPESAKHRLLDEEAEKLKPGQTGLLALDWNNGNRCVLVDQRLTGLLVGQTLHTRAVDIYRALVEATAFGALTIINRIEEYGVKINEVINCGGIAEKSSVVMQIYADVTNREMKVSGSSQTCALGSAIAAAVVAGSSSGGYDSFADAQAAICTVKEKTYKPIPENVAVYADLYRLYKQLHDGFGIKGHSADISNVMKELLDIKESANA
ncbi:Ribulokinase [Limihaloglobus sulfuriphilus]|uniref:Ribulokinase n=1 Tax=Limihaloglobus sulfuriphilus TaxID=1851148 RepID=A0A1Q2MFI5_9BACT|nr:ribulokinase [Limihaloglobus sulfuriphilus]AQQ71461.1 Ribulokinase [Limihaloglobus sulfuriphilus]